MEYRKVFVNVIAEMDVSGGITPLAVIWESGRRYEVDRVKDVRRAYAAKVGGTAIRYTVSVLGRVTFLFYDGDKWFVESNQPKYS